jgi:hypothetical protein
MRQQCACQPVRHQPQACVATRHAIQHATVRGNPKTFQSSTLITCPKIQCDTDPSTMTDVVKRRAVACAAAPELDIDASCQSITRWQ